MRTSVFRPRLVAFAAVGTLGVGCAQVDATVQLLNGPTAAESAGITARAAAATVGAIEEPGAYALSPSTMTLTVTGVGFVREGDDPERTRLQPTSDCVATYDRSLGSLASLGACATTVPQGTYDGVVVGYETTFEMVIDDEQAGIWSDPDMPGLLNTTRPANGPGPISVVDTNTDATGGFSTVFFDAPLTLDADHAPEVFVLFDPTHWMKSRYDGAAFGAPFAAGNPPILPSVDGFAKAAYYSNVGTAGAYRWDGCSVERCMSLLFLYKDANTPTSVSWQDYSICPALQGGMAPVVAFAGDRTQWGVYGRLGRDATGTLAWASAEQASGSGSDIVGYNGVYRMPEGTTTGDVLDLDYLCTGAVPAPFTGDTYASGAPDFTPQDSVSLTLMY